MEMEQDKQQELLNDLKSGQCSCYELGNACYDKQGDYTHEASEECNN